MAWAVAFLMSGSSVGLVLQDTDHGNNDADDCYYNTCDSDSKLYCQIYYVPFVVFSICTTSANTGSSQNVLILAKGEPLPVLVTPCYYYNIFVLFCKRFLLIITNLLVLNFKYIGYYNQCGGFLVFI